MVNKSLCELLSDAGSTTQEQIDKITGDISDIMSQAANNSGMINRCRDTQRKKKRQPRIQKRTGPGLIKNAFKTEQLLGNGNVEPN